MEFFEAPVFTRFLADYLGDEDYRKFQAVLMRYPEGGDLIPDTGGFRKIRWPDPRRGKGRRGGLRLIYFYFPSEQQIWMLTLYDKNEMSDLTKIQKQALKKAIEQETRRRQWLR